MTRLNSKQKQAKILRNFRKAHKIAGALLFVFFFVMAVSGIILGWKNNSNGLILPKSQEGISTNLKHWLPLEKLHKKATTILIDSISKDLSLELNRIDIRKNKGMVKFIFKQHLWEVQLDGSTGDLLQLKKRNSDFIESIHDGSFIDAYFNTSQFQFKIIYTTIMGLALLLFTTTGFWLWYGPKKLKRLRLKR